MMKPASTNDQQEAMRSGIILQAQQKVLDLYNQNHNNTLLYHTFQRTQRIAKAVEDICTADEVEVQVKETALLAAWFCQVGLLEHYENGEQQSQSLAELFLRDKNYPSSRIKEVLNTLHQSSIQQHPATYASKILKDAIHGVNASQNFFEERPLLRLEWELSQERFLDNFSWNQLQLQELLRSHFYTAYGKIHYEPLVAQNILLQKKKIEKTQTKSKDLLGDAEQKKTFKGLVKKVPGGATQTYFRTNYRNHINLSAIADNKANIMISVNAILISVVISILSYRNIPETQPMVLLPVILFLVTALISLIFAVLSIRPKVTTANEGQKDFSEIKKNVVFFGNFVHLDLETFEEAMDEILRDGALLYGNMVRDIYYLGKVLDKKYRFLTLSYNIFMVGFVVTVLSFIYVLFL